MSLLKRKLGGRSIGIGMIVLLIVALAGAVNPLEAKSPGYPSKPITIINPWAPGSLVELFARAIGPQLSKMWGVPIEVITKSGGSGIVASQAVMSSPPNGYTILADGPGTTSMQIAWETETPYKVGNRTFLARVFSNPFVIVVSASSPWKTMGDVEQAIRKDPDSFVWASCGSSFSDLPISQFRATLTSRGVDLSKQKVAPFQGLNQAIIAIAGDNVSIHSATFTTAEPLVKAGKLRILAVTSSKRYKFYPDMPTAGEQGFPNVVAEFWGGYTGPPGLPKDVLEKWTEALKKITSDPEMTPIFDKLVVVPAYLAGSDFEKYIMDEAKAIKAVTVVKAK